VRVPSSVSALQHSSFSEAASTGMSTHAGWHAKLLPLGVRIPGGSAQSERGTMHEMCERPVSLIRFLRCLRTSVDRPCTCHLLGWLCAAKFWRERTPSGQSLAQLPAGLLGLCTVELRSYISDKTFEPV
jgi:hypothetical protein